MERPVLPSTKTPWFRYPEDLDPVLRDIRDNLDVLDSDVDDIQSGALPIPLAGIEGALGEYEPLANMRAGTVNVLDFLDETNPVQAALDAGAALVIIPPHPDDPSWEIDDALTMSSGTSVTCQPGAVIEQVTVNRPVFDCYGVSDVTINTPNVRYEGDRTYNTPGSFRGGGTYEYSAGVYIANCERVRITDMTVYGFEFGVSMSGWNGSARTSYLNKDIEILGMLIDTVDMAVLASGFDGLTISRLRGAYTIRPTGTDTPPLSHMVYISGSATELSRGLVGGDWSTRDGSNSYPYFFRNVRGVTVGNLYARNCPGLLGIIDCEDVELSVLVGADDVASGSTPSIDIMQTGSGLTKRITLNSPTVVHTGDSRLCSISGDDVTINDISAVVNHGSNSSNADIQVAAGSRNAINRPRITNTGAGGRTAIQIESGASAIVTDPVLAEVNYGVRFIAGSSGSCRYDPAAITLAAGAVNRWRVYDQSGAARVERISTTVAATVSGASTVTPNATAGTHYVYTFTTTGAVTIATAVAPWLGAELSFEVYNNSGGSLAITWGGGYVFRSAWSSPSDTNRTVIRFRYDGANWQEVSRA